MIVNRKKLPGEERLLIPGIHHLNWNFSPCQCMLVASGKIVYYIRTDPPSNFMVGPGTLPL
jgi:hypothetical protein